MVTFRNIESALIFAAQIQQFYQPQVNYLKDQITSRIGLYLGVVDEHENDVFGSGVNQASRVEGKAQPGAIWLNNELREAIGKVWGESVAVKFLHSEGEFELKGIAIPPKQKLFSFNWQDWVKTYPEKSLAELVFKHLQNASVMMPNLGLADFANQPVIIWPVKPRDDVNAIHCGQLEIVRLMAMLGAQITVLIADCGSITISREYSENFKTKIAKFARYKGLKELKYIFMSELFNPNCPGCDKIHVNFQSVISQLKFNTLIFMNNKAYEDNVKEEIKGNATLDFLHPALTISAVLHLSKQVGQKCIILAGYDEKIQWEEALDSIPSTRGQFGVLFNPILKKKDGTYQGRQKKDWPLYFYWEQMVTDMEKYNLASWLMKLHLYLYHFPSPSVQIGGSMYSPADWENDFDIEAKIDKEALAKYVFYNILKPSDTPKR